MRLLLVVLVVGLFLVYEAAAISCYYGNMSPNMEGEMSGVSKIKLMSCPKTHRCCSKVTSSSGVALQCAKDCPEKRAACGPDSKSGISGASWCYCKSHRDKNCQP